MVTYKSQVFPNRELILGLNIGCGGGGTCFRIPYINLDINRKKHEVGWKKKKLPNRPEIVFIIADATHLPFKDNIFDEVYASHLLEHFNKNFTLPILKEWVRVLKVGGLMKICVPNFQWTVDVYTGKIKYKDYDNTGGLLAKKNGIAHSMMGPIFQNIYGHIPTDNSQYVGHKVVFDYELLSWFMERAGLKNIRKGKVHSMPYQYIHDAEIVVVGEK